MLSDHLLHEHVTLGSGQFFTLDHVCVSLLVSLRALESGSTSREPDFSQWPSGGSVGQKCGFEKFVPCCGPHLIVVDLSTLDITSQQTAAALAPDQPSEC